MAELARGLGHERAAAFGAAVAVRQLADVCKLRGEIATRLDSAQMPAVAVRAGHELSIAELLVRHDLDLDADRSE